MKKIAVTGATGFVGKRLIAYNEHRFQQQVLSLRTVKPGMLDLEGVDAIVHLAGKAHQMEPIADSIYFDINYELTKELADNAKKNGVPQFIYISSTKVYGDETDGILDESSVCRPTDAYGASKLKAEQYLQSICTDLFRVAIVRPPIVYGPEVRGNMLRLLKLAEKKIPLPFGKVNNARSMVFVDNLVELINTLINKEASGIFIAGDRKPMATNELIALMRIGLGNKNSLVSIPSYIKAQIKKLRPALYTRLFASFIIDNTSTNEKLHFFPPYTAEEGVAEMVNWFKNNRR